MLDEDIRSLVVVVTVFIYIRNESTMPSWGSRCRPEEEEEEEGRGKE